MNKIFHNKKGQVIGKLDGKIFFKVVDKSKHFMRLNQSWGIDLETFKDLPEDTQIMLADQNNQKTYRTDWKTYSEFGTVEDFGHDRQVFLNIDKFNETGKTN
jgi:hypothetical protein